jgi:hypothetical protein
MPNQMSLFTDQPMTNVDETPGKKYHALLIKE